MLRPVEAAEAIGISRSKIYELLASGELPCLRIGASVGFPLTLSAPRIAEHTLNPTRGEHSFRP